MKLKLNLTPFAANWLVHKCAFRLKYPFR